MGTLPLRFRILAVIALLSVMATSCLPERTSVDPAIWEQFAYTVDFTLTRDDINCHPSAIGVVDGTTPLSAHYVVDGQLGQVCFGKTSTALVDSWKALASVVPRHQLEEVGLFVGYTNNIDTTVDSQAVGYASARGWHAFGAQVSIDLDNAFVDRGSLMLTLVHEMGHVISASKEETVPWAVACDGFDYRSVCYRQDSLFVEFVALYWTPADLEETKSSDVVPSPESGRARCQGDPGYVTPYGAANAVEDFAETFKAFVFDAEAVNQEQQARFDWFASKPELSATRDYTRLAGYDFAVTRFQRCR